MTKQVSDKVREQIIKLYNEGQPPKQISVVLGCSRFQVYRVVKAYNSEGRISRKNTTRKQDKLTDELKDFIIDEIQNDCSITLKALRIKLVEKFQVKVCANTIAKAIGPFSYSLKRIHFVPERQNTPEIIDIRYTYIMDLLRYLSGDQEKIFFIDETVFNVSTRRAYGLLFKNSTPFKAVPQIRSKNFNVSLCITKSGVVYSETSERSYDKELYGVFLTNLVRTIKSKGMSNGVFIMNNEGFQMCEEIKNLFTADNHTVLYLPPYSPFLNPIEEAFNKVKIIVKREKPKNEDELILSINTAFNQVTPEDCIGYFNQMESYIDRCRNKEIIS